MTATVITTLNSMGRWQPGARGRLARAALELYAERGYEQTTVADIALRAGVTERTFFRHFADKREVLFDGSQTLQAAIVEAVASAPDATPPIEIASAAMMTGSAMLVDRDYSRRRAAVIAANPSLQERELLKLAALGAAVAAALRERGIGEPTAGLAAETGVAVFKIGFETWIGDRAPEGAAPGDLAGCIRAAADRLKALAAET